MVNACRQSASVSLVQPAGQHPNRIPDAREFQVSLKVEHEVKAEEALIQELVDKCNPTKMEFEPPEVDA